MSSARWQFQTWILVPISIFGFQIILRNLAGSASIPDPIAIHWGLDFRADGFIALDTFLLVVLSSQLLLWIGILSARYLIRPNYLRKFLTVLFSVLFWFTSALFAAGTLTQLGSESAKEAGFPMAIFVLLAFLIPFSLWIFLARPEIEIADALLIRLRKFKMMEIPLSDIVSASISEVDPRKFGGYGLRIMGNRIGFISSKGKALVLRLVSGEEITIRSDGAEEQLRELKGLSR
ncbi:MAG: hypothetical protein ACKOXT_06155 [Actinomycetota bacterium]